MIRKSDDKTDGLVPLIGAFLIIFGPNIPRLSGFGDTSFFFAAILIFIAILKRTDINQRLFLVFTPLFILYLYLAITASISLNIEVLYIASLLLKPIRIAIVFVGAWALVTILVKKNPHINILKLVFYSISCHGLIMILQLLNPDFKDLIYSYLNVGDYRSTFEYQFRMGGLSGGTGGAVLSVVQSVGVVLVPFVLKSTYNSVKSKFIIYVLAIICFISVLISGRSGLLAIIIFLPVSVILCSNNLFVTFRRIALLTCIFLISVMSLLDFVARASPDNASSIEGYGYMAMSFSRSLDSLSSMIESGNIQDNTISTLWTHILFPQSLKTLIFGDPSVLFNAQFDRDLKSDIGYIRNLWGMGIIGSLLFWLPLFCIQAKLLISHRNRDVKNAAFLVGLIMIFFQLKEHFYYVRMLFPIYGLLVASALLPRFNSFKIKSSRGMLTR
jgi:hypothetical protein